MVPREAPSARSFNRSRTGAKGMAPNGTTTEPSPIACLPSGVTKNVAACTLESAGFDARSVTKTVTLVTFGAVVG